MSPKLKLFLLRWANYTVAVLVAANVIRGIHYDNLPGLVAAAFLLGVLNTFVRRWLILLSLPLVILTLGLFMLVINAVLLYAVGYVMTSFHVDSFTAAFWGGLIISLVSIVLNFLTGTGNLRMQVRRAAPPPADRNDGGGPVIDV
jgi:putative membrane protein